MTKPKKDWEKEFDEWYADPISEPEIIKKVIRKAIFQERQRVLEEIEEEIRNNSYRWEVEISKKSPYQPSKNEPNSIYRGLHHNYVMSAIWMKDKIKQLLQTLKKEGK